MDEMKELDDNIIYSQTHNNRKINTTTGENTNDDNKINTRIGVDKIDNDNKRNVHDIIIIAAICETILAIPILGGIIIISMLWIPLFVMLATHIIILVLLIKYRISGYKAGPIMGIITSLLGFIPIIGMLLHIITAIILWVHVHSYSKKKL